MKMTVFWDVKPCSLGETDRHFIDAYCLPKTDIFKHQCDINQKKKTGAGLD
jgi:hypothetical protein